jgi:hypothetical protein
VQENLIDRGASALARTHHKLAKGLVAVAALAAAVVSGSCSSVTVRRASGPCDEGVHYWLPKPYFKVTKGTAKAQDGTTTEKFDVEVVVLPNPDERRTIVEHAGFGSAKSQVTLAGGWNLTQMNQESAGPDPAALIKEVSAIVKPLFGVTAGVQGKSVVCVLLGVDMSPCRQQLFDERIVIWSDGSTDVTRLAAATTTTTAPTP